jgi:hypothetical protein
MRYLNYSMRILLLAAGVAALFAGVAFGEWGETMFNAALL